MSTSAHVQDILTLVSGRQCLCVRDHLPHVGSSSAKREFSEGSRVEEEAMDCCTGPLGSWKLAITSRSKRKCVYTCFRGKRGGRTNQSCVRPDRANSRLFRRLADSEITLRRRWGHLHSLAITKLALVPEHNFLVSIGNDGVCKILDCLKVYSVHVLQYSFLC